MLLVWVLRCLSVAFFFETQAGLSHKYFFNLLLRQSEIQILLTISVETHILDMTVLSFTKQS